MYPEYTIFLVVSCTHLDHGWPRMLHCFSRETLWGQPLASPKGPEEENAVSLLPSRLIGELSCKLGLTGPQKTSRGQPVVWRKNIALISVDSATDRRPGISADTQSIDPILKADPVEPLQVSTLPCMTHGYCILVLRNQFHDCPEVGQSRRYLAVTPLHLICLGDASRRSLGPHTHKFVHKIETAFKHFL